MLSLCLLKLSEDLAQTILGVFNHFFR